ncbi:MAG: response regulator [Proteobacteria bacterium]|nr:response regulator [Pseudomonadota bacterium]
MSDEPRSILIVDDNVPNLQFLGKLLEKSSYDPTVVTDGAKALEFLREKLPDLILLDIMMPVMDGFEVCRKIKANSRTKHIPVIFLTAKSETEDIVKGFEVGGVDYVTKPFNIVELLARIKTHVEMSVLRGLVPICSKCKNIRDDKGFWKRIEEYIESRSEVSFTHGICPSCAIELYGDEKWFQKMKGSLDGEK